MEKKRLLRTGIVGLMSDGQAQFLHNGLGPVGAVLAEGVWEQDRSSQKTAQAQNKDENGCPDQMGMRFGALISCHVRLAIFRKQATAIDRLESLQEEKSGQFRQL